MFTLIMEDIGVDDLLDFDFDSLRRKCNKIGYDIGIHLNEKRHKGYFTLGITSNRDFTFTIVDGRIYLIGGIDLPYFNTPICYMEEDMEELLVD